MQNRDGFLFFHVFKGFKLKIFGVALLLSGLNEYGFLLLQGIELAQNSIKHPIVVSSKRKYEFVMWPCN